MKLARVRFARHLCPVQAPGGVMVTQLGEGYVLELRDGVVEATGGGETRGYPWSSVEGWTVKGEADLPPIDWEEASLPPEEESCPYCGDARGKGETCGSRSCRAKLREDRRRAQDAQELTTEKS